MLSKLPELNNESGRQLVEKMIATAGLTRNGFRAGDLSTVMSPRTVLTWAENIQIFDDVATAFRLSFLNRCEDEEKELVSEYYFRCFGEDLETPTQNYSHSES